MAPPSLPGKRRADESSADDGSAGAASTASTLAKRTTSAFAAQTPDAAGTSADIQMLRQVDVKAFGLEDRAEAVIAMGKSSWSLAHLAKWRSDALAPALTDASDANAQSNAQSSEREYLRQRQRAYRKQCLASAATRTTANSSNSSNSAES